MLRSASSLFVLSLLALQVAIVKAIDNGIYLIEDNYGGRLGLGAIPDIFPRPDVPVRVFERDSHFVEHWKVKKADDGALTISVASGAHDGYKIIANGDYVFASTEKNADTWSVTSVGGHQVEIKVPYKDEVFTTGHYEFVTLQHAQGLPSQKWSFIRTDRELYHRNRFCVQESW
ncbi:hypothetical protein BG006_008608 [Podila minutissima]|uniref:Lectin n=1 Tax=Podila minutissima TaxID=64525 RepID=A0A9P5VJX2_9FUNG|nr:hypothetical protein BG006_008608 [Podila minutissima]